MLRLINIGFGNMVAAVKRLIQDARERLRVVDCTQGRRTRAVSQTDSDHLILSAIQPETIAGRLTDKDPNSKDEEREA